MEKIRKYVCCILLFSTVAILAACGREDTNGTSKSSGAGSTATETGAVTTTQSGTIGAGDNEGTDAPGNTSSSAGTNGESGGVLKDMVDDVENGVNQMSNGISGTSAEERTTAGQ